MSVDLPEEGEDDKPDIIIEDFGKMLAKQDEDESKVLLYSKLGTINFEDENNSVKQESEVEVDENLKSVRLSEEPEELIEDPPHPIIVNIPQIPSESLSRLQTMIGSAKTLREQVYEYSQRSQDLQLRRINSDIPALYYQLDPTDMHNRLSCHLQSDISDSIFDQNPF